MLGISFLFIGIAKFTKQMVVEFERYRYPAAFRIFTGLVEIMAAAFVTLGIWKSQLAIWGSALIVATMIGAIFTHLKLKDPLIHALTPFIFMLMGGVVMLLNLKIF
ncbi:DoxX family protein [Bacillus sp. AGMB 02131]|uniref:DoxX family protein n=2 Tax=Peribacillus faecalis TaxID=2772559 RepID=A0A927HDC2_9BACI|nr:DoxX family protein [Peribacillus faecalis]